MNGLKIKKRVQERVQRQSTQVYQSRVRALREAVTRASRHLQEKKEYLYHRSNYPNAGTTPVPIPRAEEARKAMSAWLGRISGAKVPVSLKIDSHLGRLRFSFQARGLMRKGSDGVLEDVFASIEDMRKGIAAFFNKEAKPPRTLYDYNIELEYPDWMGVPTPESPVEVALSVYSFADL